MVDGSMIGHSIPGRSDADGGFVCPVCEGQGTQRGLRNHLRYDHGWETDRIRSQIGVSEDADDASDSTPL